MASSSASAAPSVVTILDTLQRTAVATLEAWCASSGAALELAYASSAAAGSCACTCTITVRPPGGAAALSAAAAAGGKKEARAKAAFAIVHRLLVDGAPGEAPLAPPLPAAAAPQGAAADGSAAPPHFLALDFFGPVAGESASVPASPLGAAAAASSSTSSSSSSSSSSSLPDHRAADGPAAPQLQPFEAFVASERPQMLRIQTQAVLTARQVLATLAPTSSSPSPSSSVAAHAHALAPLPFPAAQVPAACHAASHNYLACAVAWAVAFTNESRRLGLERGAARQPAAAAAAAAAPATAGAEDGALAGAETAPQPPPQRRQRGAAASAATGTQAVPAAPAAPSSFSSSSSSSSFSSSSAAAPSIDLSRGRLRVAAPADARTVLRLIRELAAFEREPEAVRTDEAALLRDGFSPARQFHCVLLELPQRDVGRAFAAAAEAEAAAAASVAAAAAAAAAAEAGPGLESGGEGIGAGAGTGTGVGAVASGGAGTRAEGGGGGGGSRKRPRAQAVVAAAAAAAAAATAPPSSAPPPGPAAAPTADGFVAVAFALAHASYSTWEGRALYLEDLYVQPPFRRCGASGLLFRALSRAAVAARCARLQWSCLAWNAPAVAAYEGPRMRAARLGDWRLYRFVAEDLQRLAAVSGEER